MNYIPVQDRGFRMDRRKLYVQLLFFTSLIATMGSLYFSEVRQYVPCEFCWYQRILMYPIVIISFIALVRQDFNAKDYIRALSIPGILMGGYHYALQKVSLLGDGMAACKGVSCTVQYINWLGFITIPLLSFIAFTLILILTFLIKKD